jgi:ankyrin repeat protein
MNLREAVLFWVCVMALIFSVIGCKNESASANPRTGAKTLMEAAGNHNLQEAQAFIAHGADVNQQDVNGVSVLYRAIECPGGPCDTLPLVKALIEAGAKLNGNGFSGNPLGWSVSRDYPQPKVALELIRDGANADDGESGGDSSLMVAATDSSYEVMRALLEHGANPNRQNSHGQTALCFAAMNGLADRVSLLLRFGARTDIGCGDGKDPVAEATTTNPAKDVQKKFEETRRVFAEGGKRKS